MGLAIRSLLVIGSIALLGACSSNDSAVVAAPPSAPLAKTAKLQVVHAVANAPTVSVGNAASTLVSGLDFKETSGFATLVAGTLAIQVDADVPGGQATVIPLTDVVLAADMTYSVLAIGEVDSLANPISPLIIGNPDVPIGAGNVRVEIVHGAPGAPPVDIHVTGPADPLVPANAIAGGSTAFGSNSGQLEVPAGDYRIRVALPGTTTTVFDSGTVTLPAGADLLVVAVDNTVAGHTAIDAPPITLLVSNGASTFEILDVATPAEVRVVHAVPDAPAVDVYINDSMATNAPPIAGLGYAQAFPMPVVAGPDAYAALEPGTNNVLVTVAGNPGAIAIPPTDLDLTAGRQYSVYASGTLATIAPFVREDDDRSIATEARVRIIHLAPSAGLVDVYVTAVGTDISNENPAIEDVDFQADTGYLSLAGMPYDVTVTLAG